MIRLINGQHIENFSLAGAFLMEGGSVNVKITGLRTHFWGNGIVYQGVMTMHG